MFATFYRASSFNSNVSSWDVSRVETMMRCSTGRHPSTAMCLLGMFRGPDHEVDVQWGIIDSDVSSWIVSRVETMAFMFYGASSFNSDVSSWDVSRVETVRCSTGRRPSTAMCLLGMFRGRDHDAMFYGCSSFNSDVSSWNGLGVQRP